MKLNRAYAEHISAKSSFCFPKSKLIYGVSHLNCHQVSHMQQHFIRYSGVRTSTSAVPLDRAFTKETVQNELRSSNELRHQITKEH